jgi:hypothetical protein
VADSAGPEDNAEDDVEDDEEIEEDDVEDDEEIEEAVADSIGPEDDDVSANIAGSKAHADAIPGVVLSGPDGGNDGS